jgi:hypothetical protein
MTDGQNKADAKVEFLNNFLMKDYELKVQNLRDHFTRMWTRFNYFIGLETLIAAAVLTLVREGKALEGRAIAMALVGAVLSLAWYLVGTQDRYLIDVYRSHIRYTLAELFRHRAIEPKIFPLLKEPFEKFQRIVPKDNDFQYPYTGGTNELDPRVDQSWLKWRLGGDRPVLGLKVGKLSVTTWPALFPVIALALWLVFIVVALAVD